ncbi:MAG: carboxyl-terminal processing protease [Solirubrobacterales bacterium]|nr:carboxyl-terminal processing protease [Solirubrobacterales bacterium]
MRARRAVAFAVALAALFAAGLWLGGHPSSLPDPLRDLFVDEPAGLTAEAAEAIEDNYYRPVGETELGNASLQGMVRELRRRHGDRFSEYFSPEALEGFNEQIEGHFSGIGLTVVEVKKGLRVASVFPRSPAQRAGIAAGETIVSVNGESIAGEGSNEATKKIKGPEGTEVTIGVRDAKGGKVRRLTLTRAEVTLPNVSRRVERVERRKLGYVRLFSFSEGAHGQLANAVRRVRKEGAEGIVLDLRHNPGGLLEEAVRTASLFLSEGEVVVSTNSRSQGESTYETSGGQITKLPLVVLIDGGTASAAEILTAALADDGGAETVGTRSFGKGVFQEEQALSNGGALKLTVGEYFTPKGVNLAESHGIHPDVKVKDNPKTKADEAEQRAFEVLAGQVGG